MNSSQLFGLFRHAATTIGGILMASGTPQTIAVGALLVVIGGGMSFAKNASTGAITIPLPQPATVIVPGALPVNVPVSVSPLPQSTSADSNPPISTVIHSILFWLVVTIGGCALGSLVSGCASTGGATLNTTTAAAITQVAVKNALIPVLEKNPSLEPSLNALALSIDDVFAKGTLTPSDIAVLITQLGAKYPALGQTNLALIASLASDAYTIYTQASGTQVVVTTDPGAALIIQGFKQGILDGITFYHALHVSTSGGIGLSGSGTL